MSTMTVRKPTAERREEIAQAVLRIIGEQGLTALTTTSLAKEVGVTSGALFRHFASREDILTETVAYALRSIERTFPNENAPPVSRLLELARNRIRLLGPDPGLAWLLRSEQAYHAIPEDAAARLRDLVRRSRGFVLAALREGSAGGTVRSDIDPEDLLVPVMATIHALIGMSGMHRLREGPDPDRVLAALERLIAPPAPAPSKARRTSRPNRSRKEN